MTPDNLIITAVLAQGLIAFVLLGLLGMRRLPLVAKGEVKIRDIALNDSNWPAKSVQASNAFNNQFQLPVLFYVACAITLYLGVGWWSVVLAWLFVVSRVAHAVVFATSNHVPTRFQFYFLGLLVLCLFWLTLIVRLVITMTGA